MGGRPAVSREGVRNTGADGAKPHPYGAGNRSPIRGFAPNIKQKKAGEEPVDGYIQRLKRVGFRIQVTDDTSGKRQAKGRGPRP